MTYLIAVILKHMQNIDAAKNRFVDKDIRDVFPLIKPHDLC